MFHPFLVGNCYFLLVKSCQIPILMVKSPFFAAKPMDFRAPAKPIMASKPSAPKFGIPTPRPRRSATPWVPQVYGAASALVDDSCHHLKTGRDNNRNHHDYNCNNNNNHHHHHQIMKGIRPAWKTSTRSQLLLVWCRAASIVRLRDTPDLLYVRRHLQPDRSIDTWYDHRGSGK